MAMAEGAKKAGARAPVGRKALKAFDIEHLRRYTFEDPDLERELLGLFQDQLPALIERLEKASDRTEWRLASHTLKGSARSVGAPALAALALELEDMGYQDLPAERARLAIMLRHEADAFSHAVTQAYSRS
jgi:HPt (histidine-containing phosphotransfer) domain-containing protein